MNIIPSLVIGILTGWLLGVMVKNRGLGLLPDLIFGIVGSFVGILILEYFSAEHKNVVALTLVSLIGSLCLVAITKIVKT